MTVRVPLPRFVVFCPRCKIKMIEKGRVYHGQRKWVCPRCRSVRMQRVKGKGGRN